MTLPDIDTIATYGGALTDYVVAATDTTTDRPAASANKAYANAAMATHTVDRCFAIVTLAATTGAMALGTHDAVWGTSVAPTLSRSATGVFLITWPATVTDELGVTHTVNLRSARVGEVRGATAYHCQVEVTAANVAQLRVWNTGFAANDAVGVVVSVYAG